MNKTYAYMAGGLVCAMLGWLAFEVGSSILGQKVSTCAISSAAGGGAIGGPFELVSETGETVTDADVIDKPALIYFGYTYCPDVCPVDVSRNAEAVDLLQARGYEVKPVFISIDPERDTPETLLEYTEIMHPDMLGLAGSPEQVKAASQAYKTFYRKNEGGAEDYLVDHSTFTYLMLPETGFAEFFRNDVSAEEMARVTACFIDAS